MGSLAATFYLTQLLCAVYRGQRDFLNTAYGGLAAGAALGAALQHGVPRAQRGRSVVLGAALGGCVGVPVGLLQEAVVGWMGEGQRLEREARMAEVEAIVRGERAGGGVSSTAGGTGGEVGPARAGGREYDVIVAVVGQLERSLASSPTQQAQRAEQAIKQQQSEEGGGRWRGGGWFGWGGVRKGE